MATEILTKSGTPIVWDSAGTSYGISLEGLIATSGAQGAKGDLGAVRAREFDVDFVIKTGTAPTAGKTYNLYWCPSVESTVGSGNPGGCNGTDSSYKGYASSTIAASVQQLEFVGALVIANELNTRQNQHFVLAPPARYGMPVVVNNTDQTSNAETVDHQVRLTPLIDESQ